MPSPLVISPYSTSKNLSPFPDPSRPNAPGGNLDLYTPILVASTKVSNTGSVAGSTVIQLYVSFPQSSTPAGTPVRVLQGFEKGFPPTYAGHECTVFVDKERSQLLGHNSAELAHSDRRNRSERGVQFQGIAIYGDGETALKEDTVGNLDIEVDHDISI